MSTETPAVQDWTAEDVETLARWMGWIRADGGVYWYDGRKMRITPSCKAERTSCGLGTQPSQMWNPFADAEADYMVLERAREVWSAVGQGVRFSSELECALKARSKDGDALCGNAARYRVGDWSRAVLAVLRYGLRSATPEEHTENRRKREESDAASCKHEWTFGNPRGSDGIPRSRTCRRCQAWEYDGGGITGRA